MNILLYTADLKDVGDHLKESIQSQFREARVNIHPIMDDIIGVLRKPLNNVSVVILMIAGKDELSQLEFMNSLFDNIRIILILPDRRKDTLSLGLKLKPSFISYIDNDLQDITSVLGQILKQKETQKK